MRSGAFSYYYIYSQNSVMSQTVYAEGRDDLDAFVNELQPRTKKEWELWYTKYRTMRFGHRHRFRAQ